MRLFRPLLAVALIGVFGIATILSARPHKSEGPWLTDFGKAEELSKKLNQPMLVHFYASWCRPCQRMEKETLRSGELAKQLESHFVAVKVDADERLDLVDRLGVSTLPADVFVDPNGRILKTMTGYRARNSYLAGIARVEAEWRHSTKTQLATSKQQAPTDSRNSRGPVGEERPSTGSERHKVGGIGQGAQSKQIGASKSPSAHPSDRKVCLNGYSPVTLRRERKWIKGKSQFASTYKDVVYHMATAEELAAFKKSPYLYAPRLLGCDPVVLWETDRAVPGSTQFGAYFDGELFLFVSQATRTRFKRSPMRYVRTRHVLRSNQRNRTRRQ
jgi:thioredoxin-related protein/YHS domain-containing protein